MILFVYIYFIRWVAARLNDNISADLMRASSASCIGGIVVGVVAMFQPWFFWAIAMVFFFSSFRPCPSSFGAM